MWEPAVSRMWKAVDLQLGPMFLPEVLSLLLRAVILKAPIYWVVLKPLTVMIRMLALVQVVNRRWQAAVVQQAQPWLMAAAK